MPSGPAFAVGTRKFAERAARREAADLVGLLLREPQIAVGAERDADRRGAGRRQGEFGEGAATRIEAADLGRAAFAEPQIAVRPLDADIGRAVGAWNPMFADKHRARRAPKRGSTVRRWLTCPPRTAIQYMRIASGMLSPRCGDSASRVSASPGIATLRPAPSGRGSTACAVFMRSSSAQDAVGKRRDLLAVMSTCKVMFSEVADTQFSVACSSCSNKWMRLAS